MDAITRLHAERRLSAHAVARELGVSEAEAIRLLEEYWRGLRAQGHVNPRKSVRRQWTRTRMVRAAMASEQSERAKATAASI